jgi:DNA-directed RNA polymerase specialized sigma24 family protein
MAHPHGLEETVAEQDAVRGALACLPPDHRACLLLYAWTGLSSAEIAPIVGRSAAAVRMILVRARREFRAAYRPRSVAEADGLPAEEA